ncbi:hypothetical protein ACOMCU_01025 [Lysinibacillus sp. UGB7]|uniref:hypothetical protein n=1 Tax=Lysinibacillus sp. UGB7 TaxID=3411039 RepID=UPI003B7C6977
MFKKVRASIINRRLYNNEEIHKLAKDRYIRTIWIVIDEREIIDPETKVLFQHLDELMLDNAKSMKRLRYKEDWTFVDDGVFFHIRGIKDQEVDILVELFMVVKNEIE